ncbi:hypothetical protein B0A49_02445 [Cryomyces minteri]|uniref:CFEM domain-containing protein n=1 Tax=Cryomyces minteri TaxID=331657 RepID=A0A4U0XRA4_9PEZI|nr:hypothetical protein B0A49_02445 [Cryomyces minteri]
MRSTSIFFSALAAVAAVSAQSPASFAAQIPACVESCDHAAIASVGCGLTDYPCHCSHGAQLKALILPCLQNSSNCTTAELTKFGTLVGQLCVAVNATAANATAAANTTASATGTGALFVPSATSSVVPYTGAATYAGVQVGLVAAIGAAVSAFAL